MSSDAKNRTIRNSIKATRERRADMQCSTIEVKVIASKMNCLQKDETNTLFREAKWRRNDVVADYDSASRDAKDACVKIGDSIETRAFTVLSSQMSQDIYDRVKSEIVGLATKKSHGDKVGHLKFKSYCNCVPLRQYGVTYKIDFSCNTIKVTKISKSFKVRGLKQIPKNAEIANAVFLRKPDGLYFHITIYTPREQTEKTGRSCGIDFGIEHNLTLQDGTTYDISVPESKGVKLASRRLNRSLKKNGGKKSRRHYRRLAKLRVAHQKLVNKRNDTANKIVYDILSNHDFVAIQDEMIHNWHAGLFGKQVQISAMGSIKTKLKNSFKVYVVERSYPSTQLCPVCGKKTKHPLSVRHYKCSHCGYYHPSRDVKSAQSLLTEAIKQVSAERRTYSSGEVRASAPDGLPSGVSCKLTTREAQVL